MVVHGQLSIILSFVLTGLSTLVVALRFYSRHFLAGRLRASDWVMLLALLATWFSVVVNWYVICFFDYSRVNSKKSLAKVVSRSLLSVWIYRLTSIITLCLIKTSILLFYRYIASTHKYFHYLVRALITGILVGSASMIIAAVFTCYPVQDSWSFETFEAGINGRRRRLELMGTFSIGIMAIIGSAVRLRVIYLWLSDFRLQQKMVGDLLVWTQVEQNVGIIAGSIPFLRPIFRKALARFRLRTKSRDQRSPGPVIRLIGDNAPDQHMMPRALVIPSPTPTFESHQEFRMPKAHLPPIEPVKTQCAWGSTIWDGTQVRQVLPT
ncbi:hypothetical protein GQ44DRAFT_745557 [Phaeosphaeriaceae sp. PMI808]|nr:hypothetical protein GQ44DRAFT_745557 [Phaeosphaeriaceae sp. PMI808]